MEIFEAAEVTSASRMRRETSMVSSRTRLPSGWGSRVMRVRVARSMRGASSSKAIVVLDGLEGESAVHGAGFEVEEAEAAGKMRGESAFACAGGPVDGDDGALAFSLARWCWLLAECFVRLRHSGLLSSSGLNLRAGGRLPKGFLFPLNLSKVLAGLPVPLVRIW